ncbi:MAG: A1 family peptidase [Aliivibrio sp.]|uniref:pepsin-like aspartic protease n=1 Tax=Aliivibrio sp. TaxID=1872443 RepID=UPI001A5EF4AA|nr:A1 family peptidase [Aliivibrio sp.]
MSIQKTKGFNLSLIRGPFQNNGATPWYCELGLGTPSQKLKFCFDTGSNFNWVTSSLCAEDGCHHHGGGRFIIPASSSFIMTNPHEQPVSFGPWGTMQVKTGEDDLLLPMQLKPNQIRTDLFVASEYTGSQFEELNWDGGIGIPSSQTVLPMPMSTPSPFRAHYLANDEYSQFHFFLQLIEKQLICRNAPYVSFLTESTTKYGEGGTVGFGVLDDAYAASLEYIFMPWSLYQESASYLWSTAGAAVKVDGMDVGEDMFFTLDSGSSQFKGDNIVLTNLYNLTMDNDPVVAISLRSPTGEEYGLIEVTSDIYRCKIEAGKKEGQVLSQFQGLEGADKMLLVGSVIMDHLYTVYEYEVLSGTNISPKGVWIFNKLDGPKIIKTIQNEPATLFTNPAKGK